MPPCSDVLRCQLLRFRHSLCLIFATFHAFHAADCRCFSPHIADYDATSLPIRCFCAYYFFAYFADFCRYFLSSSSSLPWLAFAIFFLPLLAAFPSFRCGSHANGRYACVRVRQDALLLFSLLLIIAAFRHCRLPADLRFRSYFAFFFFCFAFRAISFAFMADFAMPHYVMPIFPLPLSIHIFDCRHASRCRLFLSLLSFSPFTPCRLALYDVDMRMRAVTRC